MRRFGNLVAATVLSLTIVMPAALGIGYSHAVESDDGDICWGPPSVCAKPIFNVIFSGQEIVIPYSRLTGVAILPRNSVRFIIGADECDGYAVTNIELRGSKGEMGQLTSYQNKYAPGFGMRSCHVDFEVQTPQLFYVVNNEGEYRGRNPKVLVVVR